MKRGNLNIVSDKESDTIDIADIDMTPQERFTLKVGDWSASDGGYGQIVKLYPFFYEEYHQIPKGKKVGDYHQTYFIIKYFCSYKGIVRRNGTGVDRVIPGECGIKEGNVYGYWEIIQKCIKENPEKYLAYQKYKVKNVESWKYVGYMAGPRFSSPEHTKEYFQELFVKIRSDLPDLFTFNELMEVAKKHECPIKFDEPEFRLIPTFELYLYYNVGESRSKRILFHAIRISFNGNFYHPFGG